MVVIVVLLMCCFGCGTFLICSYQVGKASKQISEVQKKHLQAAELKKKGLQNASESQIEIDQQYALPEDMDIDIFSKKRPQKFNDDVVADNRASHVSERNLVDESRNVLDSSKKRLVRPQPTGDDSQKIVANIKAVVKKDKK